MWVDVDAKAKSAKGVLQLYLGPVYVKYLFRPKDQAGSQVLACGGVWMTGLEARLDRKMNVGN